VINSDSWKRQALTPCSGAHPCGSSRAANSQEQVGKFGVPALLPHLPPRGPGKTPLENREKAPPGREGNGIYREVTALETPAGKLRTSPLRRAALAIHRPRFALGRGKMSAAEAQLPPRKPGPNFRLILLRPQITKLNLNNRWKDKIIATSCPYSRRLRD